MEKSKLLARLRLLSKDEMNDFVLFAESPYFNNNAALTRLLKYLQKYHPELKSLGLSKPLVYKKIFPKKDIFKERRITDLMSHLFKLSEDFFAFEQFKNSPISRARHELLAYRDNHMDKDFQKAASKIEKILSKQIKDENYYLELYLLNKEVFQNPATERVKQAFEKLKISLFNLDVFFIFEKINLAATFENRKKVYNEKYVVKFLKELKEEAHQLSKTHKELAFAEKMLNVIETEEISLTKSLSKDFEIIQPKLNYKTSQIYLFTLLNILSRKFRKGNDEAIPLIFTLYKFGESKGILLQNGKISLPTFNNVCQAAIKQNEKEWQQMFFDKYQNSIYPPESRNDAINLVQASVLFEELMTNPTTEKYKEAIIHISRLNFQNKAYTYKVKSQLLRIYFLDFIKTKDFAELEFLSHFCHAFETQLNRDTTWNTEKTRVFLKIVSVIKRLAKYIYDNSEEKIKALIKELQSSPHFLSRDWIIKIATESLPFTTASF